MLGGESAPFAIWYIETELSDDEIDDCIGVTQLTLLKTRCLTFLHLLGDTSVEDMKSCVAKPSWRSPTLIIVLKGLFSEVYPRGYGIGFVILDAEPSLMMSNIIDRLKSARDSVENLQVGAVEHTSVSKPSIP